MSRVRRLALATAAVAVAFLGWPAAAHADGIHGCPVVTGTEVATFTSATTSVGTIAGPSLIAGTTAFSVTGAGSDGTYTGTLQDTTAPGTMVTSDTGVLQSDGTFVEVGLVQGQSSTGAFRGAVGSVLFNGSQTSPGTFTSRVYVVVCLR
jgi:hypothetical protein